jgi:uncharacterized protein (UPF0210 family)
MRIRSITSFIDPDWPLKSSILSQIGQFSRAARKVFVDAGYEVQSTRLATVPFPTIVPVWEANSFAIAIQDVALEEGFDYVSIGPVSPENPEFYAIIPEILSLAEHVFTSGFLTFRKDGIAMRALRQCAEVICHNAIVTPDGFTNLRFCALANVQPHSPFFPAAFHQKDPPGFALAIESADLAVSTFSETVDLTEARENIVVRIESEAHKLEQLAVPLSQTHQVAFYGLDFSYAPFPQIHRSIGTAFEKLGISAVGHPGSLAAAAILTEVLDRANFTRTGFNGLMLPLLEDATLAERAAQGLLSINDLLLYSAVCGTGLDTIPLPGNTSIDQLMSVLLDVAALSLRLNKPLTARLMPIPGKSAGDLTNFEFAYFVNSRVLSIPPTTIGNPLANSEIIPLRSRSSTLSTT